MKNMFSNSEVTFNYSLNHIWLYVFFGSVPEVITSVMYNHSVSQISLTLKNLWTNGTENMTQPIFVLLVFMFSNLKWFNISGCSVLQFLHLSCQLSIWHIVMCSPAVLGCLRNNILCTQHPFPLSFPLPSPALSTHPLQCLYIYQKRQVS